MIPSTVIAPGTFLRPPFLDRSSFSQRLQSQELGQHPWVRTSTLGAIAHLLSASHDARFLGTTGSEVSSGQSGLHGANPSQASPFYGEVFDLFSADALAQVTP